MELFGFGNQQQENKKAKQLSPSFVPPTDQGSTVDVVSETNRYGINFDSFSKDSKKLIDTYRHMATNSDVISAIDEIVNASIVNDPDISPVEINLDKVDSISESIKTKITDEFQTVLRLLKFNESGDDLFRQWYVDGRLYFHIIVPKKNRGKEGIEELRLIDPRKIKKVREIIKERGAGGVDIVRGIKEYYVFTDDGLSSRQKALQIAPEAIICVTSGMKSVDDKSIVSYLQPALKPFNQLVALEDSLVIYRIARAPERRVFYVDTGNLPPTRADQYMRKIINSHKNKTVYDSVTGSVKDNKHLLSMMEDIWLPRKEGTRGTEVSTLPGGQGLGDMDDVLYFMKKLYKAMRIPSTRLDSEQNIMQTGVATEISRDELKFASFIDKVRKKFSLVFRTALKTQLILKKIIAEDEWEELSAKVQFKFNTDSQFAEMKDAEIMSRRVDLLQSIDQFVGKYMSIETVRKDILNQTEEEYKEEDKRMSAEKKAGLYKTEEDGNF